MAPTQGTEQFIILPPRGVHATDVRVRETLLAMEGFRGALRVNRLRPRGSPGDVRVRVIDSVHEDGAKLVELSPESVHAMRAAQPSIRIVPVVFFHPAVRAKIRPLSSPMAAATRARLGIDIQVVSSHGGAPVEGAQVVAFTDFAARRGLEATTDANGRANLPFGASSVRIERLYVFTDIGFWSRLRRGFTLVRGMRIALRPAEPGYPDALHHFHHVAPAGTGRGVTVGVVDTGIDTTHPDLSVNGGMNTVQGENPSDFGDNGGHHGTHVAGIIAGIGSAPTGMRGLAPGVTLRSYRVFGQGSEGASNFAILKAIDRAVADGCDLINLSLGGPDADEATREAIEDARVHGSVVIAAAGNNDRSPVSFPAANSQAIAVSAVGRKGTYPRGTSEGGDVASPFGSDPRNFLASFSNVGMEIDVTGAGVGIVSTVPGGYTPMSGTSMACPAVTGIAARILGGKPAILRMHRNEARSTALAQALLASTGSLGLGPTFEGSGLPNV